MEDDMKKNFFVIGISIIAIVLLIFSSLSNVVGYQSVKSTVNDSPLFIVRTQRATNQEQNSITSRYLGMGEGNLWQFPIKDNSTEQLKKTIEVVSKMGDRTFAQFIELCINKVRKDNTLQGISDYQIVQALLLLKTNPKAIVNSFINRNNQDITYYNWFTLCQEVPFCIVFNIIFLILFIAAFIHLIIEIMKAGPTSFTCISVCMCLN
jgi:hypothetical protein